MIKLQIKIIMIFVLALGICQANKSERPLKWYSFNEGYRLAMREKKPLMIDFYADWCSWCAVMEEKTFNAPEVKRELEKNYIAVRINTQDQGKKIRYLDHKMTYAEFMSYIGVSGLPTVVFFNEKGRYITKIPGYIKKEIFLPMLKYINKRCYERSVPFQKYLQNPGSCD